MTTYQTAGASLVLLALACLLPSTVQLIKRRLREHADAELVTELQRVMAQRDRYHGLYNEAVQRNAVALSSHARHARSNSGVSSMGVSFRPRRTEWDDAS